VCVCVCVRACVYLSACRCVSITHLNNDVLPPFPGRAALDRDLALDLAPVSQHPHFMLQLLRHRRDLPD